MDVPLLTLGVTARAWDEQHLDVDAAAEQVASAPTSGFTAGVAGTAARFTAAWRRHTAELAATAETRADGLRTTAADLRGTDLQVARDTFLLDAVLREER